MTERPIEKVLAALPDAKPSGKRQWAAKCPAHPDRTPSLSVHEETDGRVLLKCHANCTQEAVVAALGLTMRDLFPQEAARTNGRREEVARYTYTDEQGRDVFQVRRYLPKGFAQFSPDGKGDWRPGLNGARRVLYHLPDVLRAAKDKKGVYVCEGEQDSDRLLGLGLCATTNAGGAEKWRDDYAESLRGAHVAILPDNDDPGRGHAEMVARSCHGIAASIRVVKLPGLKPKGDVSDWLDAGGTLDALRGLVRETPEWAPTAAIVTPAVSVTPGPAVVSVSLAADAWPDPVDGLALHRELVRTFKRYLVLPNEEAAHALALWVLFSHAHGSFEFSPLLVVTGATRGCGKTRVCDLIRYLSPRAQSCVGVSDAALFRMIEARRPTVMVDEADNIDWRERKELAALLNAGFSKGAARIPRCVGDDHRVKDFSTWCPKVLAGRSARRVLLDTTVSRSIVIDMRKRLKRETVERFRERKAADALIPLCRQAARWAADNTTTLADLEPTPFDQLEDRAEDAWTPLFAIADLLGIGREARQAALVLSGGDAATDDDTNVELLRAVRQVFADEGDPKHLPTSEILAALRNAADSPWGAWNKGNGIRDRDLSKQLHDFGLAPKTVNVGMASNPKGYSLGPILVALAPYDDFIRNSTTSGGVKGLTGSFSSATSDGSCGTKSGAKSFQGNEGCGVAEKNAGLWDGDEIETRIAEAEGDAREPEAAA